MTSSHLSLASKDALFRLVARLSDNKYFLGRRYADWCSSAPTLESSVAAAAMAQDELGHARALYPLLRTLSPEAGPEVEPETRADFMSLATLDAPFEGWQDFVAANFLIDTALTTVFAAAQSSRFEPLAGRSRKVLQEERMHAMHGDAWVRRMAGEGAAVRASCEEALRRVWNETLCWFGPAGREDELAGAGVLDATPDELRSRFLAVVGPTIEAAELNLPVRRVKTREGWELIEALPWSTWDAHTYRLVPEADRSAATRTGTAKGATKKV